MSHIFISYSKSNIEFARYLRSLLQDKGFAVWMDETRLVPSERWWPTIEQNIITCDAFIVIMSPESKASTWVEREILVAENADHRKPIFPVLLSGNGWSRLADIQYENMRAGLSATLRPEFVEGLKQFVAVNTGQPPPPLPAPILTPAVGTSIASAPRTRRIDPTIVAAIIGAVAVIVAASIALLPWLQSQFQTPANTTNFPSTKVPATSIAALPTTIAPSDTPTLDIVYIVNTLDAQSTAAVRATNIAGTSMLAATPTWTPSPNLTASIDAFFSQRANTATAQQMLDLSVTATLWTKTPRPTAAFTFTALPLTTSSVTSAGIYTPTMSAFPTDTQADLDIAQEDFQHGYMFWISTQKTVWVLLATPGNPNPTSGEWNSYRDTFDQNVDPETDSNLTPPTNLYQPVRSFGKLWRTTSGLRDALGWAIKPEFAFNTKYTYRPGGYLDQNGKYVPSAGIHFLTALDRKVFKMIEPTSGGIGRWEIGG